MKIMKNKPSKVIEIAEAIVFDSRWLLYPMTIGLIVALAVYSLKFLVEEYDLIHNSLSMDAEQIMVLVLGLVDMYMVANLLVMITKGSYQIFIRRFQIKDVSTRPQWLDHVDSGILKVKVASSIAGITLIRLLKDFVNIEHTSWEVILHRAYIHGVCLVSVFVMAVIWRLTHPQGLSKPAEEVHGPVH